MANPYLDIHRLAGEQISSTFEGRHVSIEDLPGILIHPFHTDHLVNKGEPVAFWDGCGVALKSAQVAGEHVPIDTEGIWRLPVTNTGVNPFGDIVEGQVLFIDNTGIIIDDWITSFTVFGYALQPIADPGQGAPITEIIAVKVHWMYPYWFYDVRSVLGLMHLS